MESPENQHLHINIYKDNQKKSSPNMSELLITTNEELNNKLRLLMNYQLQMQKKTLFLKIMKGGEY